MPDIEIFILSDKKESIERIAKRDGNDFLFY